MKLPPIFNKNKEPAASTWQWPSCKQPKTLSFRATGGDDVFKTVNSMFFDPVIDGVETPESWFTNSSESASFSTESDNGAGESLETVVVRGARSERLFFEPAGDTNSILEEAAKTGGGQGLIPFKESVVLAMESDDPYFDFRKSMEEMVESHALKDWEGLEQLLGWYLKVNGKANHGFVIGAFIDLILGLNATPSSSSSSLSSSDSTCYSSAVSSFPSSPFCPTESTQSQGDNNEIQEEKNFVLP